MNHMHSQKKKKIDKKWNNLLKIQEQQSESKHFIPGLLKFSPLQNCQSRIVNFFGDLHTEVYALKVNQNDKYVGAACANGQVKVYDIYQGKLLTVGNTSRLTGYPCTGFKWKPKTQEDFIACNCDGTIRWFNLNQQIHIGQHQSDKHGYLSCEYQVEEQWVALGTDNGKIQIFDNQHMKLTQVYNQGLLGQNTHNNRIFSLKCLKEDKNVFFSGGWDQTIQIFDIRVQSSSVRKFHGPLISSDSIDYKDGVLLVGNYRNKDILQLWDFKSGQLIENLDIKQEKEQNSYGFSAAFAHKSDKNLVGVALSGSNMIKILKNKILATQIQFQTAPLTLEFHKYQQKDFLVASGIQGTIYVVKLQWKRQNK